MLLALTFANPDWAGSVVVEGKEWLQPREFTNISWFQVSAVCPAGSCAGALPGSSVDLTGFKWASVNDVNALFNHYIGTPVLGPGPGEFADSGSSWAPAFQNEFSLTWLDAGVVSVSGMTRDSLTAGEASTGELQRAFFSSGSDTASTLRAWPKDKGSYNHGHWFWRPANTTPPPDKTFTLMLEEPVSGEVHSGIGNLYGWAIAEEGIQKIELYLDGQYLYDVPYGGVRPDVAEAYPAIPGAQQSGFAMAFGYSNLERGTHTITARAYTASGEFRESSATFSVVAFDKAYIEASDEFDLSQATVKILGNEIFLGNVSIDDRAYDLKLKWRTAGQRFEIIEIR
jgi:hypothetical protein